MYIMPHRPQKPPRQPKIRSSCDGCGAVKGKCNRQHPECGRCMAHSITCTYSISRKIGKPRKDRSLNGGNTTTSISTSTSTNTASENTSLSASTSASLDSIKSYNWDNNNSNTNSHSNSNSNGNKDNDHEIFNMDFGYPADMLSTSLNSNFLPSLASGDGMVPDNFDTMTASVNHFETYDKLDLSGCDLNGQRLSDICGVRDGSSPICGKDHDCHREAHELLGTSLFTNPNSNSDSKTQQAGKVAVSPSLHVEVASAPAHESTPYLDSSNGGGHGVSMDQVLLLNRKATERLASLLACPCAASPYLMMLYASLISAILMRCQHAAGSSSTWRPLISPGESVALARISIGAFRVDDPRVQSALNIQLLAGELRTVAGLIDKIALYECNNEVIVEQSGGTNVPRLYQSLAVWLRDEHSRVTDIIKSRLRELNA
jgi:hypothetical protein